MQAKNFNFALKNMLIYCTGATGLAGYNFVKAASSEGHKVVAVCGKHRLPEMPNVTPVSCDLLDEHAVQRAVLEVFPDAIVNCAAISSPADVDANPELAEKMNTVLPERLAQLANHVVRLAVIAIEVLGNVFGKFASPVPPSPVAHRVHRHADLFGHELVAMSLRK